MWAATPSSGECVFSCWQFCLTECELLCDSSNNNINKNSLCCLLDFFCFWFQVYGCCFAQDPTRIGSACGDSKVRVWSTTNTQHPQVVLNGHSSAVSSLCLFVFFKTRIVLCARVVCACTCVCARVFVCVCHVCVCAGRVIRRLYGVKWKVSE